LIDTMAGESPILGADASGGTDLKLNEVLTATGGAVLRRRPDGRAAISARKVTPPGRWLGRLAFLAAMPGLTLLNAMVGLLLPALLGPIAFGQYALMVTLFQYGLVFDFGLSQLVDRVVPPMLGGADQPLLARFIGQILWLRLYIAAALLVGGALLLIALSLGGGLAFDLLPALLAMAAGIAFMVALGPASIYRARSQRRMFGLISIAVNLILAIGRPLGVLAGGLVGCFLCLTLGYLVIAVWVHADLPPRRAERPSFAVCRSLLARGIPLFLTASVWAFYMTANRWIVSGLASSEALGQFAFAANAVYLIVGAVAGLAQFYYPRLTARAALAPAGALSLQVTRDFSVLAAGMALVSGVGMLLAPPLIGLFYPSFGPSAPALQVLLIAVPSLVVSSWLMPVSLNLARRPWLDGAVIYPFALLVLMGLTHLGYARAGLQGAGAGLVVSAQILLVMQLAHLRQTRLFRARDALVLVGCALALSALLAILLWSFPDGIGRITPHWAARVVPD
jgi:O-antigen/teichoic acid export membrane protein